MPWKNMTQDEIHSVLGKVSKKQMEQYEEVRASGSHNMYNMYGVISEMVLLFGDDFVPVSEEAYGLIMKYYSSLMAHYGIGRQ